MSVPKPTGSLRVKASRAASRLARSRLSSGGHAAASESSPFLIEENDGGTAQACVDLTGRPVGRRIHAGEPGEFPGEFIEAARRSCALIRGAGLIAHPPGQRRRHDRNDQEYYKGNNSCGSAIWNV